MTAYWVLFSLPLLWALLPSGDAGTKRIGLILLATVYVIAIGLRERVGCDWFAYIRIYQIGGRLPFWKGLFYSDSGFQVIDLMSYWLGLGYYFVNFLCGLIFTICLFVFIRRQPLPWLALLCAVPYMISVVAMGYERQSVAIGFCMLAMLAFADRKTLRFAILVLIGALFHKTLIFILPLVVLVNGFKLSWVSVLTLLITALAGGRIITQNAEQYLNVYQNQYMISYGGSTRIAVTALAGAVFLIFFRRYKRQFKDWDLLLYLSIISMILVPLVKISSTAVDRMGLYMLPFQMAVFSRLPVISGKLQLPVTVGVVASYAMFLYVWLAYSSLAHSCWLPYRNILL